MQQHVWSIICLTLLSFGNIFLPASCLYAIKSVAERWSPHDYRRMLASNTWRTRLANEPTQRLLKDNRIKCLEKHFLLFNLNQQTKARFSWKPDQKSSRIPHAICVLPLTTDDDRSYLSQVGPTNQPGPFVCWKNMLTSVSIKDHCLFALQQFGVSHSHDLEQRLQNSLNKDAFTMQVRFSHWGRQRSLDMLYVPLEITGLERTISVQDSLLPVSELLRCAKHLGCGIADCMKHFFPKIENDACPDIQKVNDWPNGFPHQLTKHPLFFFLPFFRPYQIYSLPLAQLTDKNTKELQSIHLVQQALRASIVATSLAPTPTITRGANCANHTSIMKEHSGASLRDQLLLRSLRTNI